MTTETPKEIVEYRPVEAGLALLREKYAGVVFDVATAKGLDDARKARGEIREPRYECERIRKHLKAPALEYSRRIDTEAARITAELEKLETPIDSVIKAEEQAAEARREAKRQADMERQAELRRIVESISEWPLLCLALTADGIRDAIARYEKHEIPSNIPPHYAAEAAGAKVRALEKLREMLAVRVGWQADQALQTAAAEAERERQAAEDKRLREERRRLDAELDRQHAEHARIERELAEERAQMDGLRPDAPWEDRPEPSLPEVVEVQAAIGPGTTIMRVRFEKRGGRYHCRIFTAPRPGVTFAKNGDLVFDAAEWPDIPLLMRGAEFIEETTGWLK